MLVMKAKPLFLFMHMLFQKIAEMPPKTGTEKQLNYTPPETERPPARPP